MDAMFKKIGDNTGNIFDILEEESPCFYPYWHYHPQYEIMLITESTGIRYVGDSMTEFKEGDITIIGSNIPHLFRNDTKGSNKTDRKTAKAIVVYFSEDFVKSDLFGLREMENINSFLKLSKRGVVIQGKTKIKIANQLYKIINETGVTRLTDFISLLHYITSESEYCPLSSTSFIHSFSQQELPRLQKIFDYILENFKNDITLKEVSEAANMSTTSLCKYFKSHTNRTLITFLNEIRIGHACKLLLERKDMSISEICFDCGFNNLTNFNIQFRKLKEMSPTSYRNTCNLRK